MTFHDEDGAFVVLVNAEEQYSLWPSHKEPPRGWTIAKGEAPKSECLEYVEKAWRDMRPLSLRKQMGAQSA